MRSCRFLKINYLPAHFLLNKMWFSITLRLIWISMSLNFVDNVACDEFSDMLAELEELKRTVESYTEQTDNSDLFTEALTNEFTNYVEEYDFIVVGAGSAGGIVAKKLSESKLKTLLLEAGGPPTNISDFGGLWNVLQFSDLVWGYKIKPQRHMCQGMINKQCRAHRGKAVGGTSTINGGAYIRGNSRDQNAWQEYGVTGWSWADTLPYFRKLENYGQLMSCEDSLPLHGCDGPVHIDVSRPNHQIDNVFFNAYAEIDRVTPDCNGAQQMGASKLQYSKRNGRRQSTARVFLNQYDPAFLKIESNAFVHKIIFDGTKAVGVEFIKNNAKNYRALAKREVIVSAGSYNTPQLLMWSGVGPKEELERHDIPLVADLPVGQNLDDHPTFIGLQIDSDLLTTDPRKQMGDHLFEALSGVGKFTAPSNSLSFISTVGNASYPDIEIPVILPIRQNMMNLPNENNLDNDSIAALSANITRPDNVFRLFIMLLHQKARGTVTLKSKSPLDFPVIDQNSFSEPDDVERIYKGILHVKDLLDTKAFKAINARIIRQVLKACEPHEYDSRAYWLCSIRHLSVPFYHSTGTCSMGRKGSSVVDSKLRIHGLKGIRIVDNSVIPSINSGHTNAIAMMIGLRAADLVMEDQHCASAAACN